MDSGDLRQLAGLLEGEGCFSWIRPRGKQVNGYPVIDLRMNDRDVVEWAAELMGSPVHQCKPAGIGRHPTYVTRKTYLPALSLMVQLFPYLKARRRSRIVELLDRWEHPPNEDSRPLSSL